MSYKVTAPLVIAKDQAGLNHHVYEGGVIPYLSDAQAEHFLAEGLVEKVGAKAGPVVAILEPGYVAPIPGLDDDVTVDPPADDDRPLRTAPVADWRAYAVARHGVTESDAKSLDKAELIELYGG